MHYKIKAFFLFALVVLLTGVFIVAIRYESGPSAPLNVLSQQAYDAILSGETKIERNEQAGTLYNDGAVAAYADGLYYISASADVESALSCVGFQGGRCRAAFAPDDAFSDFAQAVADGHVFDLVVSNGEAYFVESVVFTTLPVVNITLSDANDNGIDRWSDFSLASPEYASVSCSCSYRVRGASSKVLEKSSYRITLYGTVSNRNNCSLLGIRRSEEWILVSLYTDQSRLRNKVTIDLWNDLAATNLENVDYGSHMEFCELIMNGSYCGLYGLMDPVDETSLDISTDVNASLYKVYNAITPDCLTAYYEDNANISLFMELKYPENQNQSSGRWNFAYDYLRMIYGDNVFTPASFARLFNLSNAVDYSLFVNCCSLADNIQKNYYLLYQTESDGQIRYSKVPWDLDLSFGNYFYRESPTRSAFYPEWYNSNLAALDVAALLAAEPEFTAPLLASRWAELRGGVLSEDAIVGAFTGTQDELLASGAYLREADCWPDSPVDPDLGKLFSFIHARLNYLDGYFAGLTEGESK